MKTMDWWIMLPALVVAGCLVASASGQNLVPNGSFETGYVPNSQGYLPAPWAQVTNIYPASDTYTFNRSLAGGLLPTDWGNFTVLPSAADGIRFATSCSNDSSWIEGMGVALTAPLEPGMLYQFSAYVTRSNNHTASGAFDVHAQNSMAWPTGAPVGSVGQNALIGSWIKETFQFVASAGSTHLVLQANTAGGLCYLGLDAVEVIRINRPPLASAGSDQVVPENTPVLLDGSASSDPDHDVLTYLWEKISGPEVTLLNPNQAVCGFQAPEITADTETLDFKLTVSDGTLSSSALVQVKVTNVNHPPVAEAGPDQTVQECSRVDLDASSSYDPDLDTLTYAWIQTSGTTVTLSDAGAAKPFFTASSVGVGGEVLIFEVTVSDGRVSDVDQVVITVTNVNHPPVADAGPDVSVPEGTQVVLDGSKSVDPDNDTITFAWTQVSGCVGVTLVGADTPAPSFQAPQVLGDQDFVFELKVFDGFAWSSPDQVTVKVLDTNGPPDCTHARPEPSVLWPPNHKLRKIAIAGVVDPDHDPVTITILSVTQDEPVRGLGDGDTGPDAVIADNVLYLRAERSALGDGRVYKVQFRADDGKNGVSYGTVFISVPHDRKGSAAIDSGQQYDSLSG